MKPAANVPQVEVRNEMDEILETERHFTTLVDQITETTSSSSGTSVPSSKKRRDLDAPGFGAEPIQVKKSTKFENIRVYAHRKFRQFNGYLTSEVLIGFPTRVATFAELKYGQKQVFWDGVSEALKSRGNDSPNSSFPSAKFCAIQFDKPLKEQQDAKKNHKFKSGTTEELDEVALGVEEIMQDIDRVAHLALLKHEELEGVEAEAKVQECHLKRGRTTPKKKDGLTEVCQRVRIY